MKKEFNIDVYKVSTIIRSCLNSMQLITASKCISNFYIKWYSKLDSEQLKSFKLCKKYKELVELSKEKRLELESNLKFSHHA